MIKLGVILDKIKNSNIFLIHVGWGQFKYFVSDENIGSRFFKDRVDIQNVILYEDNEDDDLRVSYVESITNFTNFGKIDSYWKDVFYTYELLDLFKENYSVDFPRNSLVEESSIPSKIVAYTDRYRLFEKDSFDDRKLLSIDLDDASTMLLYLLYNANWVRYPSAEDLLNSYKKAERKVDRYDFSKILENVKVFVNRVSYTCRGSDNYMMAHHNLETDYGYENDAFLDELLPSISLSIYSYNEKYDSWEDKQKRLTYGEEENLAKVKTNEIKEKARDILQTKYSRDAHICYLVFDELYGSSQSKGRTYIDMKCKIDEKIGIGKAIWCQKDFENNFCFYKITSDNFIDKIRIHNKNFKQKLFKEL